MLPESCVKKNWVIWNHILTKARKTNSQAPKGSVCTKKQNDRNRARLQGVWKMGYRFVALYLFRMEMLLSKILEKRGFSGSHKQMQDCKFQRFSIFRRSNTAKRLLPITQLMTRFHYNIKLCRIIAQKQSWDLSRSYRVPGKAYENQRIAIFDLDKATAIQH